MAMNSSTSSTGVTWRSVITGAVLVGAISFISPWAILMVKGSELTSNAIPIIAVLLFFLVTVLAVPLLKILRRSLAFDRAELITVYVMMLVGSVVVTTGFTGSLLSVITGAQYYATPENEWAELFLPYIHRWLGPTDMEAIRFFYEGLPQETPIPWAAWTLPLISWILFILAFYEVTLCLGVLLRGQWVENERLVFPLTRLPLAMIEDVDKEDSLVGRLFKKRLMWLGFAIPLVLQSWNSLNFYHDAFQRIELYGSVVLLQGLVNLPFRLNFPTLGLAYLMSLNVSFSIWFFFLIGMIQHMIFARIGLQVGTSDIWNSGGAPPSILHEQMGGMFVLALFVLWTSRSHLKKLWKLALRGERAEREILSPRVAFLGLILGIVFMIGWLVLTGMSLYVALLLVFGALIVFIGLSRIVCEAGLSSCQAPMVPQAFITRGFGAEILGLKNLTTLGFSTVWIGETTSNMMNAVIHSLKLISTEDRPSRALPWAILLAIVVGLAGSIWITMDMAYTYGGINLHNWYYSGVPRWPFRYMASVANLPEDTFGSRMTFTSIGGIAMAVLLFLRQRFIWWPLHPIGFPIAMTTTIVYYGWFSIFLAWLFKGAILRYGGIRLYRIMLPFFLGLVLGEFFTASMWVFIDGVNGVEGNMIFNF
jgi:hypothetical protein